MANDAPAVAGVQGEGAAAIPRRVQGSALANDSPNESAAGAECGLISE